MNKISPMISTTSNTLPYVQSSAFKAPPSNKSMPSQQYNVKPERLSEKLKTSIDEKVKEAGNKIQLLENKLKSKITDETNKTLNYQHTYKIPILEKDIDIVDHAINLANQLDIDQCQIIRDRKTYRSLADALKNPSKHQSINNNLDNINIKNTFKESYNCFNNSSNYFNKFIPSFIPKTSITFLGSALLSYKSYLDESKKINNTNDQNKNNNFDPLNIVFNSTNAIIASTLGAALIWTDFINRRDMDNENIAKVFNDVIDIKLEAMTILRDIGYDENKLKLINSDSEQISYSN